LVLSLVAAVQTVLEKMQGHAEAFETEFVCQTEFTEAKEVLAEVFGKVAADELLTSIVEGTGAVCASVVAKGRSLLRCKRS
jgi:tRNA U34 5-carboxymethylaminomethyl modifying GTPase MnmE/TrmE